MSVPFLLSYDDIRSWRRSSFLRLLSSFLLSLEPLLIFLVFGFLPLLLCVLECPQLETLGHIDFVYAFEAQVVIDDLEQIELEFRDQRIF